MKEIEKKYKCQINTLLSSLIFSCALKLKILSSIIVKKCIINL